MLSVIVEAGQDEARAAGLLAALVQAAVEGLVREVFLAGVRTPALREALCEETGALPAADLGEAARRAKSDWVLVLPARIRFRDGWVERLKDHLAAGPRPAMIRGIRDGGLFGRRPVGWLSRCGASVVGAGGSLRQKGADRVRLD
jgi:hypothetical protein